VLRRFSCWNPSVDQGFIAQLGFTDRLHRCGHRAQDVGPALPTAQPSVSNGIGG